MANHSFINEFYEKTKEIKDAKKIVIIYEIIELLNSSAARNLTFEECTDISNMEGNLCLYGRLLIINHSRYSHSDFIMTVIVFCEGLQKKDLKFVYTVYAGDKVVFQAEDYDNHINILYFDEDDEDWQKDISALSFVCK